MSYYKAISFLYQGNQAEEQQKMGERLSYYQGASDIIDETVKVAKVCFNVFKAQAEVKIQCNVFNVC